MNIGAIVQARMGSQRFPGKVLHEVGEKPLLQYLLERLNHCSQLDTVVVATSTDDRDTPIADSCREWEVDCYRGSLLNVASRYKQVLEEYQFDAFVRVNGDSPLLDQRLIEHGINIFLQNDLDMVTNTLVRTYPKGQSVEILRSDVFRAAYKLMQASEDLEHVTKYFYKHQDDFNLFNFEANQNYGQVQLSVDTPQDMATFASIVSTMIKPHWEYTLTDILNFYWDAVGNS